MGGELPPIPASWVSEKMWGEITRVAELPGFKGFVENFTKQVDLYRGFYESSTPHEYDLKDPFYQKLSSFQKMVILRCIRPDKCVPNISKFVVEQLGKEFVTPPAFELPSIYKDSTSITPLIFVLSPGSDPLISVIKFAESKKK